ncbi:MAG TPA: ABC transporter permease [Longimicrobiales bacterium]|nr:ABC transporter permease [Longimicrobiales bacterium]
MSLVSDWRERLGALLARRRVEREMAEEIGFHLEMEARRLEAERGLAPEAARREAARSFGGVDQYAEATRDARGVRPVEDLLRDVRLAARLLVRAPGFTVVAVLTLALGIGANTAIFSVVRPILFESLPYPGAERIVMVWERGLDGEKTNTGFATYADVARESRSFEAVAAVRDWLPTVTGRGEPERLDGQRVSWTYFRVLGVAPALGRGFDAAEDAPGAERVVVLSHGLWRSRFGGDAGIVGRKVTLDGSPWTVVGVMPAGFENLLDPKARLWAPLRYDASLAWACRTCRHLRAVGRLRQGVAVGAAAREMDALSARVVSEHPTEYPRAGFRLVPLREEVAGGVRPVLLAVLGAVALVLLLACANVMNLLLARAAQREAEFSIRTALGASRGRLVRQLLAESLLLALVGGAASMAVAVPGVRALVAISPAGLPRLDAIRVDARAAGFAFALTTLVGVLFGLLPALVAGRGELNERIQRGTRRIAGTSRRLRGALVVAEVALALVLLVGAGLLLKSVSRLLAVSPGFDAHGLLTVQVQTSGPRFADDTATHAFFDRVLEGVRAVPGVESAALTSQLPLSDDFDQYGVHSESWSRANPEQDPSAHRYAVSDGYLQTMGIPLVRGRALTARDRADAPPVVLINESFARRGWPGEDPIGQRVRMGSATEGAWRTIVGIVGDVRQVSLAAEQPDAIYVPEAQWPFADGALTLVVRTRGDAAALLPALRRAVHAVDKDQPITRVATMERLVADSAAQRRFALLLFGAFAAVAVALAGAGLYGVLAGGVVERMREIGVRAALGASRAEIVAMVVRRGLALTTVGLVLGLAAALAATRLLDGLLFGVSASDPLTYAGVAGVLVLAALVACWVPASRAARVDPASTLRAE